MIILTRNVIRTNVGFSVTSVKVEMENWNRKWRTLWCWSNVYVGWKVAQARSRALPQDKQAAFWEQRHEHFANLVWDNIKELRGWWVKVGQFMSTRSDLLPQQYIHHLVKLQDMMPCSDFTQIQQTLMRELGDTSLIFESIDETPLASASIGQVHKAVLLDGSAVVIKIQHADVEKLLFQDMKNLKQLSWAFGLLEPGVSFGPVLDEWQRAAAKELDFRYEVAHQLRAYEAARRSGIDVKIPRVYTHLATKMVLVMEYVNGFKVTDLEALDRYNVDRRELMYKLCDSFAYQIHIDGLFNGDPHPGNILVSVDPETNDATPVVLDWGLVKEFDVTGQIAFSKLVYSVANMNVMGLMEAFEEMGFVFKEGKGNIVDPEIYMEALRFAFREAPTDDQASERRQAAGEAVARARSKGVDKKKLREQNPLEEWPKDIIFFVRVASLLHGLCIQLDVRIPFLQIMVKRAEECLQNRYCPPSPTVYTNMSIKHYDVPTSLERRIWRLLKCLYRRKLVLGCQVAVCLDGRVIVDLSVGRMGPVDSRPVTRDSLFCGYALTKGLLSAGLLHLVSNGELELTDKVSNWWDGFIRYGKRQITVQQLLSHRAGLHRSLPLDLTLSKLADFDAMIRCIEDATPATPPNYLGRYAYMTYGWAVAELVRAVSGESIDVFLREHLLKPLQLEEEILFPLPSVDAPVCPISTDQEASNGLDPSSPTSSENPGGLFANASARITSRLPNATTRSLEVASACVTGLPNPSAATSPSASLQASTSCLDTTIKKSANLYPITPHGAAASLSGTAVSVSISANSNRLIPAENSSGERRSSSVDIGSARSAPPSLRCSPVTSPTGTLTASLEDGLNTILRSSDPADDGTSDGEDASNEHVKHAAIRNETTKATSVKSVQPTASNAGEWTIEEYSTQTIFRRRAEDHSGNTGETGGETNRSYASFASVRSSSRFTDFDAAETTITTPIPEELLSPKPSRTLGSGPPWPPRDEETTPHSSSRSPAPEPTDRTTSIALPSPRSVSADLLSASPGTAQRSGIFAAPAEAYAVGSGHHGAINGSGVASVSGECEQATSATTKNQISALGLWNRGFPFGRFRKNQSEQAQLPQKQDEAQERNQLQLPENTEGDSDNKSAETAPRSLRMSADAVEWCTGGDAAAAQRLNTARLRKQQLAAFPEGMEIVTANIPLSYRLTSARRQLSFAPSLPGDNDKKEGATAASGNGHTAINNLRDKCERSSGNNSYSKDLAPGGGGANIADESQLKQPQGGTVFSGTSAISIGDAEKDLGIGGEVLLDSNGAAVSSNSAACTDAVVLAFRRRARLRRRRYERLCRIGGRGTGLASNSDALCTGAASDDAAISSDESLSPTSDVVKLSEENEDDSSANGPAAAAAAAAVNAGSGRGGGKVDRRGGALELMQCKPHVVDPLVYDSKRIVHRLIPPLNSRVTARGLAKFYSAVAEGRVLSKPLVDTVRLTHTIDDSLDTLLLTGGGSTKWGLGFQLYECHLEPDDCGGSANSSHLPPHSKSAAPGQAKNTAGAVFNSDDAAATDTRRCIGRRGSYNNISCRESEVSQESFDADVGPYLKEKGVSSFHPWNVELEGCGNGVVGMGHGDSGGSVALCFPELKLSISILLNDVLTGPEASQIILNFILRRFGLVPMWRTPVSMAEILKNLTPVGSNK